MGRSNAWAWLAILAMVGCTKPAPPPAIGAVGQASGVVVSVRAVEVGQDVRGSILSAVGAGSPPVREAMAEIIVREDGGRALSVMQPNTPGFRPGDRVVLKPGPRMEITRPAP